MGYVTASEFLGHDLICAYCRNSKRGGCGCGAYKWVVRTLSILATVGLLSAQPSAFTKLDLYPTGSTSGPLRLFENRSNGSNYAGFKARTSIASDCLWEVSSIGLYPCGDGLQTIGDPSFRVSHVYSAAATISGSGSALSITGSTSGSALDITGTGGGRAYSFYGTQRMLAGTDGYYVTPDGVAQNVVIDTSKNGTFNAVSAANLISTSYATSPAMSITAATGFNALNIQNGGGAALTWFATNALNTTGTINVGASIGTLSTVIDNAKNGTFNNVTISGTCTGCGSGISSLGGLTGATQTFATGASGSNFAISSSGTTHTFNLPDASASNRGVITTGTQTIGGAKTFNSAIDVQGTLTASSGSSPAINVSNATAFNAINVQNGGVAALSLFATTSINTIGTINVGPSIVSLATVIDNAGNLSPYSHYGSSQGSTSKRYDIHYGRFLNLRTNGASLAGVTARDGSNNITFTMGDGGGTGGEFLFYNSGLSEYFGAINGQVRYNGSNGLTSSFSCPSGEAVKGMNIQQGGVISITCAAP